MKKLLSLVVLLCLSTVAVAQDASEVLKATGTRAGLCAALGVTDVKLLSGLTADGAVVVHGLVTDDGQLAALRRAVDEQGVAGLVSAERVAGFGQLPYADNLVNLLVADLDALGKSAPSDEELDRVLAPFGWSYLRRGGKWVAARKALPESMAEWRDHDYDATGNPASPDTAVSPDNARVRFYAGPHETGGSERCGMRLAAGRAFYVFSRTEMPQYDRVVDESKIVCRDAFSGTLLWVRQLPKADVPHNRRNGGQAPYKHAFLVDDEAVYCQLALEQPMVRLNAATGETEVTFDQGVAPKTVDPNPYSPERFHYMARLHDGVLYQAYGPRLCALDAKTGKLLWEQKADEGGLFSTLAVSPKDGVIVSMQSHSELKRRGSFLAAVGVFRGHDLKSGQQKWENRQFDKIWDGTGVISRMPIADGLVVMHLEKLDERGYTRRLIPVALRAADGTVAWQQPEYADRITGHYAVGMVLDGVYHFGSFVGPSRDLKTGEQLGNFTARFNSGCHEPRAVGRHIIHADNFVTWAQERGGGSACPLNVIGTQCDEGVWPGYGMLYSGPQGCGCMNLLGGFVAISSEAYWPEVADADRLETGPAKAPGGAVPAAGGDWPKADEWPVYLRDGRRSSYTPGKLPGADRLAIQWQARVADPMPAGSAAADWQLDEHTTGGSLSAPTVADGKVFVAVPYAHQVRALDADSGKELWRYTAGAVVEHPPTIYGGVAYFGSRDGWVYAVRADNGQLVWRFLAAVNHRKISHCSQVASVWPVTSVLVHQGAVYANAGRLSSADKGLQFYKLDPATGKLLWKTRYLSREPVVYKGGETPGLGTFSERPYNRYADLLVSDGEVVRHHRDRLDEGGEVGYVAEPVGNVRPSAEERPEGQPWVWGGFNGLRSRRTVVSARSDPGAMVYRGKGYTKVAFDKAVLLGVNATGRGHSVRGAAVAGDTAIVLNSANLQIGPVGQLPVTRASQGVVTVELPGMDPAENGIAVAYGKLYLTTRDGKLVCLAAGGAD